MRLVIAFALAAIALSGCQTVSRQNPHWSYSGTGDARYEDERISAQATRDIDRFAVTCVNGQVNYKVDSFIMVSGDCSEGGTLPTLDRIRVLSDNQELLLIMGSGVGFTNTGAILFLDKDDPAPIKIINIDTMESFGDVLSQDKIVVRTGALEEGGCLVMYTKELALNWQLGRVERERTLNRDRSGC